MVKYNGFVVHFIAISNSLYLMMDKEIVLAQLGQRIRELRRSKNLTQAELAHVIGKDQQSIQRLESGKINPSYVYLCEIASGLGIEVKELV